MLPAAALVFAVSLVGPPTADAAREPAAVTSSATRGGVVLRWSGPGGCGDAQGVLDDAALLLVDPIDPGAALVVEATVDVGERAVLVLRIGEGADATERRIDAQRCDELPKAAALLVAMAIDPRVGEPALEVDPSPTDVSTDVPEPAPQAEPVASAPVAEPTPPPRRVDPPAPVPVAPRRRVPLHLGAIAGAGVGAFTLPRVAADLAIAFTLATEHARVELGATWWTPVEAISSSNTMIRGRFQLVAAMVRGCYVPRWGTIELPLCATAQAGAILGRGTGSLADPRSARAPWGGVGGGPTLMWRPRRTNGRIAVWLRTEGLAALTRPAFETAPSGLVWSAGPGALTAQVGLEVRLWSRRAGSD